MHLVQALHAGGRLFGHALDVGLDASNRTSDPASSRLRDRGEQRELFLVRRLARSRCDRSRPARRGAPAASRRRRRRGSCSAPPPSRPLEDAVGVVPVLLERLALVRRTPACRVAAIAAAAWSCVEKMLHDAQRTSAPSAFSVSISTAVWMVMCSEPAMRAPFSGCSGAYSSRIAIRPGISVSAMAISLRPQSARPRSATLKSVNLLDIGSGVHASLHWGGADGKREVDRSRSVAN